MRNFPKINYYVFIVVAFIVFILITLFAINCGADELWKVTAYCSCEKCCGVYSDGYFASGKKVYVGGVACNWLPFGSRIRIGNREYTIEDRGAKSIFGTKRNPIKAVDIYFDSHQEALKHGVKYKEVTIL